GGCEMCMLLTRRLLKHPLRLGMRYAIVSIEMSFLQLTLASFGTRINFEFRRVPHSRRILDEITTQSACTTTKTTTTCRLSGDEFWQTDSPVVATSTNRYSRKHRSKQLC
ncbi:MAG: hypothetical protein SAL70_12225, partial [Scytonema sp. PMC 1070.18]|nr:hypothetical protein [Scytonema sp. PMC 1070.18]